MNSKRRAKGGKFFLCGLTGLPQPNIDVTDTLFIYLHHMITASIANHNTVTALL